MDEKDLVMGSWYWWTSSDMAVKYVGVKSYQGQQYHEFYDPVFKLLHWCDLNHIKPISKGEK